jgi:hypothetical protein
LADPFLLEPKNRPVLEGRPYPVTTERLVPLFLLPFLAIGLVVIWAAIQEVCQWQAFSRSGVDVPGVVTRLWTDNDGEHDVFHVAYEYGLDPTDDRTNKGQSTVDEAAFRTLQTGGRISIRYLKTDPKSSRVNGQESFGGLPFFATVWNLILGLMCWLVAKHELRKRRLQRGRLLSGEVIEASAKNDSDGDYRVTLDYRFVAPDGERMAASASRIRNDLRGEALPRPGTPLVVQYADDGDSEPL